jgi:predicted O-methyltransferase YrrM
MPPPQLVKTTAFILRRRPDGADELLVHSFLDQPELPWRLPGGGAYEDEPPVAAMRREIAEEVGLENLPGLTLVRELGVHEYFKPYLQADVRRHDFLFRVAPAARDRWTHRITGSGGDAGELYGYRWIGPEDTSRVDAEHAVYLRSDYLPELFAGPAAALRLPAQLVALEAATAALGFSMASDRPTGQLLRTLAASKPGGRLLELGTGTGVATAWLLDGMDAGARLLSVDDDASVQMIAHDLLGADGRLTLETADAGEVIRRLQAAGAQFDLVFADTWPGKYRLLAEALALLRPGGLYVVDDLLPQPNWPSGHQASVDQFLAALAARPDLWISRLDLATGIGIATKR